MKPQEKRIASLRRKMVENGWDAIYLGPGSDLQYIIGVERGMYSPTDMNMHGEEVYGAFLNQDRIIFVIPQLAIVASEFGSPIGGLPWITDEVMLTDDVSSLDTAKKVFSLLGNPRTMAVNARAWTRNILLMKQVMPNLTICDAGAVLAGMRAIKDETEIGLMRGAGRLTDIVFGEVLKRMKPGTSELDILEEIRYQCFINGGSGVSFHPSAAVRNVTRFFHEGGQPRTALQPGAVVSFDFGVIYQGYASDFGRTVFVGDPSPEYIRYHKAVMETQQYCIDAMQPGQITAAELNALGHRNMEKLGLGDMFIHRLGHGVGIDVHETPYAYPGDHTFLQEGMVMAIEPSCYKAGVIGVRVEDIVLVTKNGGERLSTFSHELLVI